MRMRCLGTLILAALVMPVLAQTIVEINEGQVHALSGNVTDPAGAAMANVTVVRTSVNGKKVLATTHTDSNGHFSFKVPDGRYTLRFVAPGFKTMIIRVTVFHKIHKMLNVEMSVGMSQGSGQTQPGGASATRKVIKDPAEYNAYITALNSQEPAARAAAMEAFVMQYPQSVVQVDGLEQAMAAYQEAGNQAGVEDSAKRILLLTRDNIRALAIVTAIDRSRASGGDQGALKETCTSARTGQQRLPSWQKPEGVADAGFAKLKNQMADIFNGAAGFCALQAKNYPQARDFLTQAFQIDPTSLQDAFQLAVSDLEMNPIDVNGLWYCSKAITLAQHLNNAQAVQQMVTYCKAKYKRYHGSEDGWDYMIDGTAAENTLPPSFPLRIKPALIP